MEKYHKLEEIGRGSYGVVFKALNTETGELVAVKKMTDRKYHSIKECMNLREVKSLYKVNNHPNFVKLNEVVVENDILYLVFEYMECTLFDRIRFRRNPFSETEIRNLCLQIFQGLAYMHNRVGIFHRNLKPENLLVSKDVIKIADFGQAREINAKPPNPDYITTRWYRAPEVLLHARAHDSSVDMWAMGAIMFELFTLQPLFKGSSATDVMHKICSVIGTPTETTWSFGIHHANNIRFPEFPGVDLSSLLPSANSEAINLISALLSWSPCARPTAEEALQHPFFYGCYCIPHPQFHGLTSSLMIKNRDLPLVFKMAMRREMLKRNTRRLESCLSGLKGSVTPTEKLVNSDYEGRAAVGEQHPVSNKLRTASRMEKYHKLEEIGRGSYGVVSKALNTETGELVAIKKMIDRMYHSIKECMNLREVKSLCKVKNHPNIVKLKEVIVENKILFLVFEYMECTLFDRMRYRTKPFSETEIRNICFQIFQGLEYMHNRAGYFHRDLKPENLLVSKDVIKIADLGQAREINGKPPYTDYVTLVLLHARAHGSSVDMWAMGAIMFELFTLQPLFEASSATDVMRRICSVIGTPTETTWSLGIYRANNISYRFPDFPGCGSFFVATISEPGSNQSDIDPSFMESVRKANSQRSSSASVLLWVLSYSTPPIRRPYLVFNDQKPGATIGV
ncbi:hypothetical protein OSB04_023652 [Centaurea solstitialis]|uniref:Protein kinase domain-containing protein n=1 Tax=Centaurea solstitialis TaxID=347529 RepID=A0AA38SJN0_9ASTR|nr:hypothetical protein OSB04_023652 [Centaurea solstitialis]